MLYSRRGARFFAANLVVKRGVRCCGPPFWVTARRDAGARGGGDVLPLLAPRLQFLLATGLSRSSRPVVAFSGRCREWCARAVTAVTQARAAAAARRRRPRLCGAAAVAAAAMTSFESDGIQRLVATIDVCAASGRGRERRARVGVRERQRAFAAMAASHCRPRPRRCLHRVAERSRSLRLWPQGRARVAARVS